MIEKRLVLNKKYVLGISDFRAVILDVLSLGTKRSGFDK